MKIPVPKQRLIFHGKLLIDNEKLSKYKVRKIHIFLFLKKSYFLFEKIEEGHVLHLVANPLETNNLSQSQGSQPTSNQNQVPLRSATSGNELDILTGIIRTISNLFSF